MQGRPQGQSRGTQRGWRLPQGRQSLPLKRDSRAPGRRRDWGQGKGQVRQGRDPLHHHRGACLALRGRRGRVRRLLAHRDPEQDHLGRVPGPLGRGWVPLCTAAGHPGMRGTRRGRRAASNRLAGRLARKLAGSWAQLARSCLTPLASSRGRRGRLGTPAPLAPALESPGQPPLGCPQDRQQQRGRACLPLRLAAGWPSSCPA